jgi:hypothetical protein
VEQATPHDFAGKAIRGASLQQPGEKIQRNKIKCD